jgi:hypothetical protein
MQPASKSLQSWQGLFWSFITSELWYNSESAWGTCSNTVGSGAIFPLLFVNEHLYGAHLFFYFSTDCTTWYRETLQNCVLKSTLISVLGKLLCFVCPPQQTSTVIAVISWFTLPTSFKAVQRKVSTSKLKIKNPNSHVLFAKQQHTWPA